MKNRIAITLTLLAICGCQATPPAINTTKLPDDVRAQQIKDLEFGMFICWSFSTFSGQEWTRGVTDVNFFKATGCDTDQWCKTARDAGMRYILFLTKHHDGFCLWDTDTTVFKVTRSPLGIDVLAKLRKSCDKYGLKLALYFSEGDWTWIKGKTPEGGEDRRSPAGRDAIWRSGENTELKKAQLKELCTQYGPIEFFWMDHAQGTGGLNHPDTVEWVHRFQPNCFVGFNHGEPTGRINLRERGKPGPIGDASATRYNKDAEASYKGYLVAEFTYPILPAHQGGAQWFYSLPEHDDLCHPAEKIFWDYAGAVKHGNVFSVNVGPDYKGRIRDIDVKTLREVRRMMKSPPAPPRDDFLKPQRVSASSEWGAGYTAAEAVDNDESTRWGAEPGSRSGWLEVDLGPDQRINEIKVIESSFARTQEFVIEYKHHNHWQPIVTGTTLNGKRTFIFNTVTARHVRLNIRTASDVPTIEEFQVFAPAK
ncbi:alpha-L-fucosidase [Planctomycetota bacterium]